MQRGRKALGNDSERIGLMEAPIPGLRYCPQEKLHLLQNYQLDWALNVARVQDSGNFRCARALTNITPVKLWVTIYAENKKGGYK